MDLKLLEKINQKILSDSSFDYSFKRDCYEAIIDALQNHRGVALDGLRRVGKTILMKQYLRENFNESFYININNDFDSKWLYEVLIDLAHNKNIKVILLDEIQNLKNWGDWITELSNDLPYDVKIIFSGSASVRATKTSGSSRFTSIKINPLKLSEYKRYKGYSKNFANDTAFKEYAGARAIFSYVDFSNINLKTIYTEYMDTYLYNDIVKYEKNIYKNDIKKIIEFFKHNSSGEIRKKDLIKKLWEDKSRATRYRFLEKNLKTLEDYNVIKILPRYSRKGHLGKSYKVFLNPHLYLILLNIDLSKEDIPGNNIGYFYESYILFYNLISDIKGYIKQSDQDDKYRLQEVDFLTKNKWVEVKITSLAKNVSKSLSKMFLECNQKNIEKIIISLSSVTNIKNIKNVYFYDLIK